ncbi:hypothetical protein JTB14_027519 [Gonioctena quinquepunctata]|nr:hypothetical protein JTB14_027519 [Gonioctena quinquepunctata]
MSYTEINDADPSSDGGGYVGKQCIQIYGISDKNNSNTCGRSNGLGLPLYPIDDQWIGLSPYPTIERVPEVLSPGFDLKLTFFSIQPVGTLGIHTQEEISNAQRILTLVNERNAVEYIIARRVAGLETTGQRFSTLNLFNIKEMKELARNTMRQVWGVVY